MTLNTSRKQLIERRRLAVSQLRLRGMTILQICTALEREGIINPRTGRAYTNGLIWRDIQALEERWKEQSLENTNALRGKQLAEIREARALAWRERDLQSLARLIKLEMDLMGTAAPDRSLVLGATVDVSSLSDDELLRLIEG